MQASRDRRARAGKLAHRGLELGELVFVAAEVADPFRRERDPRDRVGEPLPRELDRQPAVVARAHARGYSYAVLGGPGDRHEQRPERIEHLRRPFERALDVGADALGGFRSSWIAKGRRHRQRMRDALQVAAQAGLVQLEPEGIGRDIFESVRLVDHDMVGLRQKRPAHPRVLQQERVVHDNDSGVGRGFPRALQIAVHARRPLAPALVA